MTFKGEFLVRVRLLFFHFFLVKIIEKFGYRLRQRIIHYRHDVHARFVFINSYNDGWCFFGNHLAQVLVFGAKFWRKKFAFRHNFVELPS